MSVSYCILYRNTGSLAKVAKFYFFFQNFEVDFVFHFFPFSFFLFLLQMPENLSKCLKYKVEDARSPKMDRTELVDHKLKSRCHFYLIKETL